MRDTKLARYNEKQEERGDAIPGGAGAGVTPNLVLDGLARDWHGNAGNRHDQARDS